MTTSSAGFRERVVRLSELMNLRAVDSTGASLDRVKDVRLERRGGDWVVTDLVVGRASVAERLGFVHGVVERPVVLARLMKRVARHGRVVPWDAATLGDDGIVRVSVARDALARPEGYR